MGVPAFFRWLSKKYPSIIVDSVEEKNYSNGVKQPVDCTKPNPNFQEFDNLYLDMNGIIHPCTHPEDRPAPKTEDEMFILIFEYIDRLFSIVRPRRVLYMAIDGVAPRAKMNQQRSRRFRAAKEAMEKQEQILSVRRRLECEGIPLPPPKKEEEHFDSNCITPGTPFMDRLAVALRYYVHKRISTDSAWQNIQVILSDANAPGEGEHKIMDFIRRQRASPSHDPNTVHCLCGADADLIMLGLATHEANFNILREEFVPNQPRACELCGQYGHELEKCQGLSRSETGPDQADPLKKEKNFIFIRLPVLREYLERELQMLNLPFEYDFERAIDDWVFMCFFVGNDFLPHLPSLEIRENAIDRLIKLYKNVVYTTKGWLTDAGEVHMDRVQIILKELGKAEDEIFKNRQMRELRFRQMNKRKNEAQRCAEASQKLKSILLHAGSKRPASSDQNGPPPKSFKGVHGSPNGASGGSEGGAAKSAANLPAGSARNNSGNHDDDEDDEPHDEVRLWESGWKERYYQAKFGVSEGDAEFRRKVAWAYAEGLCWVLKYYYQGCASWNWYFPYHYAPFASDFDTIEQYVPDFSKATKPFKPLEQLMGVFPAASKAHIPETWSTLMIDENSPIYDFYPSDFEIDLNGKKFAYQGVALLPFVDETRLLDALKDVYPTLNEEEIRRNSTGPDRLFVSKSHPLYPSLLEVYNSGKKSNFEEKLDDKGDVIRNWVTIDGKFAYGMTGEVCWDKYAMEAGACYPTLFAQSLEFNDIKVNSCLMVIYRDPQFLANFVFPAKRLDGVTEPERVLKPGDYNERRNGPYQPHIGFSRNVPHASLSSVGHRIMNHVLNAHGGSSQSAPNSADRPYYDNRRSSAGGGVAGNRQHSYQQHQGYQQQRSGGSGYNNVGGGGYSQQQHQYQQLPYYNNFPMAPLGDPAASMFGAPPAYAHQFPSRRNQPQQHHYQQEQAPPNFYANGYNPLTLAQHPLQARQQCPRANQPIGGGGGQGNSRHQPSNNGMNHRHQQQQQPYRGGWKQARRSN